MRRRISLLVPLALVLLLAGPSSGISSMQYRPVLAQGISGEEPVVTAALGTAFTYQGGLSTAAGPVTGSCDFRFSLFDAVSQGSQLGSTTRTGTTVTNGLFAVTLDFGAGAFNGQERFLETAVRCPAGIGAYTTLSPRQQVTPAPYALVADSASSSQADFTVNGKLWVMESGSFGGPGAMGAITLRSPDLWMQSDSSFGRGDGGRALSHTANDTLDVNHAGDFAGGVVVGSKTLIDGNLSVRGWGSFGTSDNLTAITLQAPDVYLNADSSFGRGAGGRALAHDYGDILSINHLGDFDGGVKIWGQTTIQGYALRLNGTEFQINDKRALAASDSGGLLINYNNDFGRIQMWGDTTLHAWRFELQGPELVLNAGATRGDGGRAITHDNNDTLVINYGNDFAGGIRMDSNTRINGELQVNGGAIHFNGSDFYMQAGGNRGDGGRALVHDPQDTLTINYARDFAGGVRINDLRTGKIVEENLMTPAQQDDFSLLPFTQGDVLCWDGEREELAKCAAFASPLVVGVADEQGKPIVLGAEPVKVTGKVQPGDLLVASDVAGYATAWSRLKPDSPPVGVVIAKALQTFNGGRGTIKAMIFLQ
jgi:hypothetical protein